MPKERIQVVVNKLDGASAEVEASIWLFDLIPDRPVDDKLLQKLKKAQGLINKVKRDLSRLV